MFNNSFSFNGRIRRLEYGLSNVIYVIAILGITSLFLKYGDPSGIITNILMFVIWIPLVWFMFAQGAKRCHDRNNNGWWQFIPFYGFWMLFFPGDVGDNKYGPNPKGLNYDNMGEINDHGIEPIDDVDEDGIIK